MSDGFVKLYATILTSSIWLESDPTLRVWIAMLSTADAKGYVGASVGGLAHVSRVTRENCLLALQVLMAPDPDSRTKDHDGRRIMEVEGGWFIFNIKKYRDLRTDAQIREADRKAKWRAKKGEPGHDGTVPDVPPRPAQSLEEAEEAEELPTPPAREGQSQDVPPRPYDQLLAILGDEHLPWLLGKIETSGMAGHAWVAEIRALLDGMHGPKVPVEVMQRVVQDYIAAMPKQPSLKHFRAFVRSAMTEGDSPSPKQSEGKMLRAGEIIALIKKHRNPQFPSNALPAWRDECSQAEVRAVNAVGVDRILNDKVEGVVLAQLAKMLGEAGA